MIAASFAATHDMLMINGYHDDFPRLLDQGHNIVLCTDILDEKWHQEAGRWRPEAAVISAPCQEWSNASNQPGLRGNLGLLLPQTISICRKLRPRVLGLEQVPGFQSHPHCPLALNYLRASGYDIVWQSIVASDSFGCYVRPRRLCLAVLRHTHEGDLPQIQPWPKAPSRTPNEMGAILAWEQADLDALQFAPCCTTNIKVSPPARMPDPGTCSGFRT